jgi:hypothetical protein
MESVEGNPLVLLLLLYGDRIVTTSAGYDFEIDFPLETTLFEGGGGGYHYDTVSL